MLEVLRQYGLGVFSAILAAVGAYLGAIAKKICNKFLDTKEKKEIACIVVKGVEQMYKDLKGEEKFERAVSAASEMLTEKGISFTDLELRMLIESAVGEYNNVFNKK